MKEVLDRLGCEFRLESRAIAESQRYTEDQILAVLQEIDNGHIASVASAHGITDQTM